MTGHCVAEHFAHDACGFLSNELLARRYADKAAGLEVQRIDNCLLSVLQELCNAACKLAVFVDLEPVGLYARLYLDLGAQLVDMLTGHVTVGDHDGLDGVALGKGRKLRTLHELGYILNNKVDAQVGLIRTVLLHRFVEADALKRRFGCNIVLAVLCENRRQDILNDGKNIALVGKGHLHIKLIKLAGGAVASCVLITEAGCYLEVAVKAGGHQQLLKLLRRLRQSIELARVLSCRNEVVSCTLGAGCGENWGGYLKKIMLHHRLAQCRNDIAAQDNVLLDCRVSEV